MSVPSPQQQTQSFNPPVSVTNTAQPTVQTLQQQHIEIIKDVSCIDFRARHRLNRRHDKNKNILECSYIENMNLLFFVSICAEIHT